MSGLSRDVLRWLQSLDLTWQVKSPKWDLTNGYLVAEIFSWYYPLEIEMHMYNAGKSLDLKERNWSLLKNFMKRSDIAIPDTYIEGTIHCKEGAACLLIEAIYEFLTCCKLKKNNTNTSEDFTDEKYQSSLPLHARSTASKAVKNNLRNTELVADRNIIHGQQKIRIPISIRPKRPQGYIKEEAQVIINTHLEHRRQARQEDPHRFNVKPTLGEMALRRPPPPCSSPERSDYNSRKNTPMIRAEGSNNRSHTVEFKEVSVRQHDRGSVKSVQVS